MKRFILEGGRKEVCVFPDKDAMAGNIVEVWKRIAEKAVNDKGSFSAAVSGGKTPVLFLQQLAACTDDLLWEKTSIFLTDERFVPFGDEENNYSMIKGTLSSSGNEKAKLFYVDVREETPGIAAEKYEESIKNFFGISGSEMPAFDLILLGMGEDGHTASLFPGTGEIDINDKIAINTTSPILPADRITITMPVLNKAKNILFHVIGDKKTEVIERVVLMNDMVLPASRVKPECGQLMFFIDEAAAGTLTF